MRLSLSASCLAVLLMAGCDAPAPPAVAPATLFDAAAQPLHMAAPPTRLAVIGRGTYMALHLLAMFPSGRSRLVAVEDRGAGTTDFLSLLDGTPAPLTTFAPEPGYESIAATAPDLVLTKGQRADPRSEMLAGISIPVAHLGLETPERFHADVDLLGALLGDTARAAQIWSFYQERLARVAAGVADLPSESRPRTLVVSWSERGAEVAVKVPGATWMQTQQVQLAGGTPVWLGDDLQDDGWTVVGLEQLAAWDPDVIVLSLHDGVAPEEVLDRLHADPGWALLRAVHDDRLRVYPRDYCDWNSPDPRWVLGLLWMATVLHPGRFAAVDMAQEVHRFYEDLYGMTPGAVDENILTRVWFHAP